MLLHMMKLWHPELIVMIGLVYFLYLYAERACNVSAEHRATVAQKTMFAASLAAFYAAMGSPLDSAAQTSSFALFIVQMVLMGLVIPWLFLAGLPAWVTTAALRVNWVHRVVRALTRPFIALVVYNVIANLLFIPWVFEANLNYNWFHIVDSFALMLSAVILWWPLLSPAPEIPPLSRGFQLAYILFGTNFMMPVPVFLAISQHLWYNSYVGARPFEQLVASQQLGGIIMISAMIVVYGLRAVLIFSAYDGSAWYE